MCCRLYSFSRSTPRLSGRFRSRRHLLTAVEALVEEQITAASQNFTMADSRKRFVIKVGDNN